MFSLANSEVRRLTESVIPTYFFFLSSTSCISFYANLIWLSRTFCFPGVFSPPTGHPKQWTLAVLFSPLSNNCHSIIHLGLTTLWTLWTQPKYNTCPLSTHPQHKFCPLLMDCTHYSSLRLLLALALSSMQHGRIHQGDNWLDQSMAQR